MNSAPLATWFCLVLLSLRQRSVISVPAKEVCGKMANGTVFKGAPPEAQWPWLVSVHVTVNKDDETNVTGSAVKDYARSCSAVIIHSRFLLTSFRCVKNAVLVDHTDNDLRVSVFRIREANMQLRIHNMDIDKAERKEKVVRLLKMYLSMQNNEVVILLTAVPFDWKHDDVAPICLPPLVHSRGKMDCYKVGWTRTKNHVTSEKPETMVVRVEKKPKLCARNSSFLCTIPTYSGTCHGDISSPLMCLNFQFFLSGLFRASGLMHFKRSCTGKEIEMYISLIPHYDWITRLINDPLLIQQATDSHRERINGTKLQRGAILNCGRPLPLVDAVKRLSSKIFGGRKSEANSWSWIVHFRFNDGRRAYICSGAVISTRWIITTQACLSDHAVPKPNATDLYAKILLLKDYVRGHLDPYREVDHLYELQLGEYIVPYTYSRLGFVRLSRDINWEADRVVPLCMTMNPQMVFTGRKCVIVGFGHRDTEQSNPTYMREVEVTVAQGSKVGCPDDNLCIVPSENNGVSGCWGDNGSPLMCKYHGQYQLAGLYIENDEKCPSGKLQLFENVQKQLKWINEMVLQRDGASLQLSNQLPAKVGQHVTKNITPILRSIGEHLEPEHCSMFIGNIIFILICRFL